MDEIKAIIKCPRCSADNYCTFLPSTSTIYLCEYCENELLNYTPIKGYIYILSNVSIPGLLKIGYTSRSVEERVEELNSPTGVPGFFKIEAYFASEEPKSHEQVIHKELVKFRESKEFFRVKLFDAIKIIEKICNRPPQQCNAELNQKLSDAMHLKQQAEEREFKDSEQNRKQQKRIYEESFLDTKEKLQKWQERVYRK